MLDPKEVSAEDGRRYLEDQNSPRYVIVEETSRLLASDLWDGGYVQTGWEALKTLKDLQEYSDSSERNNWYFLYRVPDSIALKSNEDFTEDVAKDRENLTRFDQFLQNRDPNQADAVIFPERENPSTVSGKSRPFFFSESFREDLQSQFVSLPERATFEEFSGDYWEPPYESLEYENEHKPEFCSQILPGCVDCKDFVEEEKDSRFGETRWELSLPKNSANRPNPIHRAQTGYVLYNETLDQDFREDGIGPFFDPQEAQNQFADILDDPEQYSPEFVEHLKNYDRMAYLVPGDTFTCQYGIMSCSDVLARQGAGEGWETGYHDVPYLLSTGVPAQVSFRNPRCQGIGRTTATVVREPGKGLTFAFDQNANFSPEFQDLLVDHEACRRLEEMMKHSGKPIKKVIRAAEQTPEEGKEERKERPVS